MMQELAIVVGCFDTIKAEDVTLIKSAMAYGRVVVLLHSDSWLRKLGIATPTPWHTRAAHVRRMGEVIDVVPFDDTDHTITKGLVAVRNRYPRAYLSFYSSYESESYGAVQLTCQTLQIVFIHSCNQPQASSIPAQRATTPTALPSTSSKGPLPINVVCLKWGNKYGAEYVNRLFINMVRNSTVPFKFHCFTDDSRKIHKQVNLHALPYDSIESWWNKLYLFSNEIEIPLGQKIFYVDLDTLITGNIDNLLLYPATKMVALRDFYHRIAKSSSELASGVMLWEHGKYTNVWTSFAKNPIAAIKSVHPHGDQVWVERQVPDRLYWQDVRPGMVASFKVHCRNGLPPNTRIICFHGKPDIPEAATKHTRDWRWSMSPQPWLLDYWKD